MDDPRWWVYENFLADMGHRPDGLTIDRKDNSRGYCKDNCRWATDTEQNRNRPSYNVHVWHEGRKISVEEAAAITGFKPCTIYKRIAQFGGASPKVMRCA